MDRLLRLPVAELDLRRSGDLISRVGADTRLLKAVVTSGLVQLMSGVVVAGGAVILMAVLDPLLLGVTVSAVAVGIATVATIARRVRPFTQAAQGEVGAPWTPSRPTAACWSSRTGSPRSWTPT